MLFLVYLKISGLYFTFYSNISTYQVQTPDAVRHGTVRHGTLTQRVASSANERFLCHLVFAGRLHLNRQVIVLMSGLGVADSAFFRLQESMIQRLAEMLINEQQAAVALSQVKAAAYIHHVRKKWNQ